MGDIGKYFEAMMYTLIALAFAAGIGAVFVVWLLWHYVLSHISFAWS